MSTLSKQSQGNWGDGSPSYEKRTDGTAEYFFVKTGENSAAQFVIFKQPYFI
jgi:hypothetical protein